MTAAAPPVVSFFVAGAPATKGSTRTLWRGRRPVTFNACRREGKWAEAVRWSALAEWRPRPPLDEPVAVELAFVVALPARGRGVAHVGRCDLDKLVRSVLDALTGALWRDDRQVVALTASKRYAQRGEAPGVQVRVGPAEATS